MRIYLSIDMEGLAGVAHPGQVSFGDGNDRVDYDRSRGLIAAEANAAIEAAFDTGPRAAIREGVRRGLEHAERLRTYEIEPPIRVEVDFRFPIQADFAAVLPDTERIGGRTVAFTASDADRAYRTFLAVHRLAGTAGL